MTVEWIEYKGQKIMYVDYSKCKNKEEMIQLLEHVAAIHGTSETPLLTLSNFEGTFGSREFMERAQKLGREVLHPKRKKGALLGIMGIKRIIYDTYTKITGDNLRAFSSREDALEYLVND
jgi:hypothetical protein